MMLLALRWLVDRRTWVLPLLALVVGVGLGRFSYRAPAPAFHGTENYVRTEQKYADTEQKADVGGWTATKYYFSPGTAASPAHVPAAPAASSSVAPAVPDTGRLLEVVVERHDPTVIETHSHDMEQVAEDRHLDLTVAPQSFPGWALQVGVEGLQARTLRLAARRRLFGPLWVEVSAVPAQRSLGVAASVEW